MDDAADNNQMIKEEYFFEENENEMEWNEDEYQWPLECGNYELEGQYPLEQTVEVVSPQEALKSVKILRSYFQARGASDHVFSNLLEMERSCQQDVFDQDTSKTDDDPLNV